MKRFRSCVTTQTLGVTWCIFSVVGCICAHVFVDPSVWPCIVSSTQFASPWCILVPAVLPFLLSVLINYYAIYEWMIILCGVKSFLYAFSVSGFYSVYGTAFWLAQLLFSFTSVMSMPVLFVYWYRCLSRCQGMRRSNQLFFLCIFLLIGGVDLLLISLFSAVI